jgi:hypothetical protein
MEDMNMLLAPRDGSAFVVRVRGCRRDTFWLGDAGVRYFDEGLEGFWPLTCEPPQEGHILVAREYGPAVCYWSDAQGDWATDLVMSFTKWYPIQEGE